MDFVAVDYWTIVLLLVLIVGSIAIYFTKNIVHAAIIFGVHSLTMGLIWLQMNSPDLAITEATAGICMTILMMVVVFRTNRKEEP